MIENISSDKKCNACFNLSKLKIQTCQLKNQNNEKCSCRGGETFFKTFSTKEANQWRENPLGISYNEK